MGRETEIWDYKRAVFEVLSEEFVHGDFGKERRAWYELWVMVGEKWLKKAQKVQNIYLLKKYLLKKNY